MHAGQYVGEGKGKEKAQEVWLAINPMCSPLEWVSLVVLELPWGHHVGDVVDLQTFRVPSVPDLPRVLLWVW